MLRFKKVLLYPRSTSSTANCLQYLQMSMTSCCIHIAVHGMGIKHGTWSASFRARWTPNGIKLSAVHWAFLTRRIEIFGFFFCRKAACLGSPVTVLLDRFMCIHDLSDVRDGVTISPVLINGEVLTTINEICWKLLSLCIISDAFTPIWYCINATVW